MSLPHPEVLGLYLVTDEAACGDRTLADVVRAAVRGGVTCVQLREKKLTTREFVARACLLKEVLSEALRPVPLLINDRLDVALASRAEGVHVGQSDMPPDIVRQLMPDAIIGLSVESIADVEALRARGQASGDAGAGSAGLIDYLGISPVFATPTKTDTAPALGLAGLATIRALTPLPLVAIGGISAGNAAEVLATGADGIAVVSAICSAPDPSAAAAQLAAILRGQSRKSRLA